MKDSSKESKGKSFTMHRMKNQSFYRICAQSKTLDISQNASKAEVLFENLEDGDISIEASITSHQQEKFLKIMNLDGITQEDIMKSLSLEDNI